MNGFVSQGGVLIQNFVRPISAYYEIFEVLIILLIHNRSKQFCTV